MTFNINEFTSSIAKSGLAHNSEFELLIGGPSKLGETRDMSMRCDMTDMPSRVIATAEFMSNGPAYNIGLNATTETLNISVILSADRRERDYIETWMDMIGGTYRVSEQEDFRLGYYDDYVGTLSINIFDVNGKKIKNIKIIDAYPIAVRYPAMSWNDKEITKMNVTFSYRYYKESTN